MINIDDRLLTLCDESELYFMAHIAKHMGKELTAFPKNETLCESTGWEIKKLQRVKKRCIEKGLIEVVTRRDSGFQLTNLYRVKTALLSVFINLKEKGDTHTPKEDMRIPQNGIGGIPQNGITEVLTIEVLNTAASEKDAAYTFEKFWDEYGFKRGSKSKAMLKFSKLTGADIEALRHALPIYVRSTVTKDTGDRKAGFKPMRKYPEFFLSGRIWEGLEDEINEAKARDAVPTPHDQEYQNYLAWVERNYPNVLHAAKHMSKTEYIQYKTTYYVEGKSKLGERMERTYMVRAHEEMDTNPTILDKYTDVFALHCNRVEEFIKMHTV